MRFPPLVKIDIGIDKCFNVQEKRNIIEGLIRWQDGTDGLVLFHIGNMSMNKLIMDEDDGYTNYSINIVKAYSTDKAIQEYVEENSNKINGLASWHEGTTIAFIVVDKLKTNYEFVGLVMHEIGHLLGLKHAPPGTIMYRYSEKRRIRYGGSRRPTVVTPADRYHLIGAWRKWLRLD